MATAEPHYLLKMLSGPHLGAEVRLAAGGYRIGRDDDADIVLDDPTMADEHALLTLGPDGVRVEPLLGQVLIEGEAHKDPGRPVPFFTVLGLGATHIAIGPEAATWPALALPAAAGGPPVPAGEAGVPAVAGAAPAAAVSRPGGSGRTWLAAVPLLLLLLVLLARPIERAEQPAAAVPPPSESPAGLAAVEPAVRAALAGNDVEGLRLEPDPRRGRLLVEGWVDSEPQRKELLARLDATGAPLTLRLWSREQVMGGVATTLQALGRPLDASWAGAGQVRLAGYIPDASDLQRAVDLLQRDVTGLKAIENGVMTDEMVASWLQHRLGDAGLAEVVKIKHGDRALVARGVLTGDQRLAFTKVADAYAVGPGRYLTLEAQLGDAKGLPAPAAPEAASFAVRAASPGPPAFIVLDDGQKYLEGSRLPGGWTLERIESAAMVVARDGRREAVGF